MPLWSATVCCLSLRDGLLLLAGFSVTDSSALNAPGASWDCTQPVPVWVSCKTGSEASSESPVGHAFGRMSGSQHSEAAYA